MNFVKTRPRPHPLWLEGTALLIATPLLLFPTFLPGLTSITLLFLALAWLWHWCTTGLAFPPTPFNLALLLWSLMLIPATLISADMDLTLPKLTGLLLGLAVWRFLLLSVRNEAGLRWGMFVLGTVGLVFVLLGLISADWVAEVGLVTRLFGHLPSHLLTWPGSGGEGVNTNQLGGILVLWPVILLGEFVGTRGNSGELRGTQHSALSTQHSALSTQHSALRPFILSAFILTLVLLLLTQSRSSWLGAAAGLFSFCLLWSSLAWSRRKWIQVWGAAAGLLLLLALILFFTLTPTQMEFFLGEIPGVSQINGPFSTLDTRREIWHWSVQAVNDFPFTGVGLGSWRRVGYRLYPFAIPIDYDFSHAHNIFLQVALDVGLPGLVAYLAMLGLAGWLGWQVAKRDEALRPRTLGLLSALIALHTYGLLDALAPGSKPGLLFWLVLGWLAAAYKVQAHKQAG